MTKKIKKFWPWVIIGVLLIITGLASGIGWERRQYGLITVLSKSEPSENYFESRLSNGWRFYRATAEQISKDQLFIRTDQGLVELKVTPWTKVGTSQFPPKVTSRFEWGSFNNVNNYDMVDVLASVDETGKLEAVSILVWTNLRKQP